MLRLLLVVVGFLAAAIWIDASWDARDRALTLRLRDSSEIVETVQTRSRALGQRAAREARERLAPVASAPERTSARGEERITAQEQQRLDRVIAEKTRER